MAGGPGPEGPAPAPQVRLLIPRGGPTEYRVAVRKPPEAPDHLAMTPRVIQEPGEDVLEAWLGARDERLQAVEPAILHRQILRVLEGQIQKGRLDGMELCREAGVAGGDRAHERVPVEREHARAAAEDVPRNLVEEHDERERRPRLVEPGVELAAP